MARPDDELFDLPEVPPLSRDRRTPRTASAAKVKEAKAAKAKDKKKESDTTPMDVDTAPKEEITAFLPKPKTGGPRKLFRENAEASSSRAARATSRSTRSETAPKDVEVVEIPDELPIPLGPSTSAKRRVESGSTGDGQRSVKRNRIVTAVPKPVYFEIPCMECMSKWGKDPTCVCLMTVDGTRCQSCKDNDTECDWPRGFVEKYRPICEDLHIMAQNARKGKEVDNDEFQETLKQIQMPIHVWFLSDKLRKAEMTIDIHKAELLQADATSKQVNELTKKFETLERACQVRENQIDRLKRTVAHETEQRKSIQDQLHDLLMSLSKEAIEDTEANRADKTQVGEEENGNDEEAGNVLSGDENEANEVDAEGEDVSEGENQESK